jgi:hypothetical protein
MREGYPGMSRQAYREEVRAVMIALGDVVTLLRQIKEAPIDGEEEEEDEF